MIHCHPPALMRGQPWYDVPSRAMNFLLRVGDPIPTGSGDEPRSRTSRRLTAAARVAQPVNHRWLTNNPEQRAEKGSLEEPFSIGNEDDRGNAWPLLAKESISWRRPQQLYALDPE